jgi:hypothetical protein
MFRREKLYTLEKEAGIVGPSLARRLTYRRSEYSLYNKLLAESQARGAYLYEA